MAKYNTVQLHPKDFQDITTLGNLILIKYESANRDLPKNKPLTKGNIVGFAIRHSIRKLRE